MYIVLFWEKTLLTVSHSTCLYLYRHHSCQLQVSHHHLNGMSTVTHLTLTHDLIGRHWQHTRSILWSWWVWISPTTTSLVWFCLSVHVRVYGGRLLRGRPNQRWTVRKCHTHIHKYSSDNAICVIYTDKYFKFQANKPDKSSTAPFAWGGWRSFLGVGVRKQRA